MNIPPMLQEDANPKPKKRKLHPLITPTVNPSVHNCQRYGEIERTRSRRVKARRTTQKPYHKRKNHAKAN